MDNLTKSQAMKMTKQQLASHIINLLDIKKQYEEDIETQTECENLNLDLQKKMYEENEKLEEENKKLKEEIKSNFLDTYIVPNFYTPEHLGLEDDEVEGFKKFVKDWSCRGEMCEIMKELIENFREEQ